MSIHIQNREKVIATLREELIGPAPLGDEIDCSKEISFSSYEEFRKPYRQSGTGDEILQRDAPLNRYGSGVLYPFADAGGESIASVEVVQLLNEEEQKNEQTDPLKPEAEKQIEQLIDKTAAASEDSDLDLSSANKYLPSSMGVSFLAEFPSASRLVVKATGARYIPKKVFVEGKTHTWYLRQPVSIAAAFRGEDVLQAKAKVKTDEVNFENKDNLDLKIEVYSRPKAEDQRLITVCLINRTEGQGTRDEMSLFQAHFQAEIVADDGLNHILPYPEANAQKLDEEERSLALLYRNVQTFAVGHGCAADWRDIDASQKAKSVSAECFPVCETPSITPDIIKENGEKLEISMRVLAGLDPDSDGMDELETLVVEYENWIRKKRIETQNLPNKFQNAADAHLTNCEKCAERMRDGLDYLKNNHQANFAFRLANHAVLLQQIRSGRDPRIISIDQQSQRLVFSEPFQPADLDAADSGRGKWRAFQIAFLLMSLRSTANGYDLDRQTVELIWFPTGGGKTEAYLGLTAFSSFMRRLKDLNDAGVNVLMRYTLRLLTAQQFQRACGLICAMEYLRRRHVEKLGSTAFSIAVWLGGSVTPNSREDAKKNLRELSGSYNNAENKFIMLRCPWCRAQMGRVEAAKKFGRKTPSVIVAGYEPSQGTVIFKCPDAQCDFHNKLPVYVIDEDIYEHRPTLVIGTVDKFAMLAWNHHARSLFGINQEGARDCSPPQLIIQDELHLISGPLGSIVGLYETLIEELCTDRRDEGRIPPKIVSSTATIRRFEDQIKNLYAREQVTLFPPPGLDAGDSFFARYARNEDQTLAPGRKYIGINAPGLGSLQNTEVRTYTALLQAPREWSPEQQDPWWTLLIFFNNLRMLGNTLTLFQSNVPDYIKVYNNRTRQPIRYMNEIEELTGRLRSDQVPQALAKLEAERKTESDRTVDVCLASNIIEVGVDVDRLSLMAVIGQPKSTSQYIQVTGRVGRRRDRPGLVISVYSPSKPRDRSHFEKFRSYHERLYAQVEPTSVTPFSPPALERALHAVMAGYVRQLGGQSSIESPRPFPSHLIDQLYDLILDRVYIVDEKEHEMLRKTFEARRDEWERWEHRNWDWGFSGQNSGSALLRPAGTWASDEDSLISWSTPQSMRNVDQEAQIQITRLYMHDRRDD